MYTCSDTDPDVGFANSTQPGVFPALLVMVLVLSACTSLITTCKTHEKYQLLAKLAEAVRAVAQVLV